MRATQANTQGLLGIRVKVEAIKRESGQVAWLAFYYAPLLHRNPEPDPGILGPSRRRRKTGA